MMTELLELPWFPEPNKPDETIGPRTEPFVNWLARSTSANAVYVRAFLNRNLAELPRDSQLLLATALRTRFNPGLFELVVARTLQLLGGEIETEIPERNGKRLDVRATFVDGVVGIEAVSPTNDIESGEELKQRAPLLDIIENRVPDGWTACVWEIPDIGPNDSKKEFRQALDTLLSVPPSRVDTERSINMNSGRLSILLRPVESGYRPISIEPAIVQWNRTSDRIRQAIASKKRKKQARTADYPVLLAIHGSGISSSIEDFDTTLFGNSVEYVDRMFGSIGVGFVPNGVFAKVRREPPTFAGVLAYAKVNYWKNPTPVLYLHPRFTGLLPESLMQLERRTLSPNRDGIDIELSLVPELLADLIPDDNA